MTPLQIASILIFFVAQCLFSLWLISVCLLLRKQIGIAEHEVARLKARNYELVTNREETIGRLETETRGLRGRVRIRGRTIQYLKRRLEELHRERAQSTTPIFRGD